MRKSDKIAMHNKILKAWYDHIATRGYFDWWLDFNIIAYSIAEEYPTISKTYIHRVFWHEVKNDKCFLQKYEY